MKGKNLLKTLWILPLMAVRLVPYFSIPAEWKNLPLENAVVECISGQIRFQEFDLITAVLVFFPVILFAFLFAVYLYSDYIGEGIYIYTRTGSKRGWFIKKSGKLFLLALMYQSLSLVSVFSLLLTGHYTVQSVPAFCYAAGFHILLSSLLCYMAALGVNLLCFPISSRLAFAGFVAVTVGWLAATPVLYEGKRFVLFALNPLIQPLLSQHDLGAMEPLAMYSAEGLKGFTPGVSLLYLLLLCLVLTLMGCRYCGGQDVSVGAQDE